jgi:5,6,7,8-tetrahydromethanopterin hydro-lyase
MIDAFSTPIWVTQLTRVLLALLPSPLVLIDEVGERHGSWEWTAAAGSGETARWLVLSVTPLSDLPPDSTERPAVAIASWQLTSDSSQILESTVSSVAIDANGIHDRDDELMAHALKSVVASALGISHEAPRKGIAITLSTGEALTGDGNELAHIDLLIGSKTGPVGAAFAKAFVNENEGGHTNLLAVVAPNLQAKPDTVITNKVTIKGEKQAVQLFGPAQAAVARAVVDSVSEGVIPKDQVDDLCLIVGVFIHWEATDDEKIYDYNYEAVKMSIARAMKGEPGVDTVLAETPAARHPFAGGAEG